MKRDKRINNIVKEIKNIKQLFFFLNTFEINTPLRSKISEINTNASINRKCNGIKIMIIRMTLFIFFSSYQKNF
tara:strand:- start:568 stop:789 length:222 start_codon:yes stop_codon:yes gene_type:complete